MVLLKREKDAERHFLFAPEVRSIAEDIKEIFSSFLVEFLGARQLLQHDKKSGLIACLMKYLGEAFRQRIVVLGELFGKVKRFRYRTQHLLACQRMSAVCVEEVLAKTRGFLLQFSNTKCSDGLYDIGRYGTKQAAGRSNFLALFLAL